MKSGTHFENLQRESYYSNKGSVWIEVKCIIMDSHACRKTLLDLGWKPSRADMGFWMKHETNPQTGKDYYAYLLVYVDDLLYLHHYS